jgi:hypothetical protein
MKVFLGTTFTNKVLPDGSVEPTFRAHIENAIQAIESRGHTVYCGIREDNWRLNDVEPGQAFLNDADAIKTSDLCVMLVPHNPISAGLQFELGLAYGLEKNIIILWQADDLPIPYMNQGLLGNERTSGHAYKTMEDLPALLNDLLASQAKA